MPSDCDRTSTTTTVTKYDSVHHQITIHNIGQDDVNSDMKVSDAESQRCLYGCIRITDIIQIFTSGAECYNYWCHHYSICLIIQVLTQKRAQ